MKIKKVTRKVFSVEVEPVITYFRKYEIISSGVNLYDIGGLCGYLHGVSAKNFERLMDAAR